MDATNQDETHAPKVGRLVILLHGSNNLITSRFNMVTNNQLQ